MKIETKEIADGKWDEKLVWICDLRFKDINDKPLRHVPPQQVIVQNNEKTTKRIYYSSSHFAKLNKKGEPTKTVIPLFDNTGFRCITGDPVAVFDNEQECVEHYKSQKQAVLRQVEEWWLIQQERYERLKKEYGKHKL